MLKNKGFITVIVLLLFVSAAFSQSLRETDEKPLFFVNTNSIFEFSSGGNYGFTVLKQIVEEAGYRFDHGLHPEINEQYLEGISVYFLPIRKFFLLDEEKVALRQFIRNGGTVIFTNWSYIRNEDTFTIEYGIEYRDTSNNNNYGYVPDSSPISGPYNIAKTHPGELIHLRIQDTSEAVALAYTDAGKIYAAEAIGSKVGKGRMFVLSCMRGIHDNSVLGYVNDNDNKNFLRNLMAHISGKTDLSIIRVKPKGTRLEPGDKFTCVAKIKNIGSKESDSVKLEFYITDDGSIEDEVAAPPALIKMVKRVNFQALAPGKSRLVKVEAKIPNWLNPGSYVLVAKVDAKETGNDDNYENNIKIGKKKLKVN